MSYTSSANALNILKRGSLKLNPELEKQAKELQKRIRQADHQELHEELKKQLSDKFNELFSVIKTLNSFEYVRQSNQNTIWQQGSTSLYEYKAKNNDKSAPVVLFIPSLINRSYILDLSDNRSFIRFLQKQDINSYLIDWGEPLEEEQNFNLDDYINSRIRQIIEFIHKKHKKKIILAGYCMGGLMAISSAIGNNKIKALALFATPWNFHSKDFARFQLDDQSIETLSQIITSSGKVPANIIQSMFYYLHPELIKQKFEQLFTSLGKRNNDTDEFIALEYWVNDGISITAPVAKECFIDWVHFNKIHKGQWHSGGRIINPAELNIPVFIAMADNDYIVPKGCSAPLADIIKKKEIHNIKAGHISMIAGRRAKTLLWQPFTKWVLGR